MRSASSFKFAVVSDHLCSICIYRIQINFQPYTTIQLEKIMQTRLASAKDDMNANELQDVVAP